MELFLYSKESTNELSGPRLFKNQIPTLHKVQLEDERNPVDVLCTMQFKFLYLQEEMK